MIEDPHKGMASHPSHNTFTYRPLESGHIRLLSISKKEELMYELSHFDLNSAPKYLTLSYTWDEQPRDQDLLVNGAALKVIKNITTLLPYFFERYQTHHIWIDGICIDQENEIEKEFQIPLMRKIYTQAGACTVWLGESNPLLDLAIPMIPELGEKFQGYDSGLGLFNKHSLAAQGLPEPTSPIWEGIYELFCMGWFTRVWTFQEATLPGITEMMCGRHLIKTSTLAVLAGSMMMTAEGGSVESTSGAMDYKIRCAQNGMLRIATVEDMKNQQIHQPNTTHLFLSLLFKARGWACSNPLDKIYGLLALADKTLQKQLTVDYKKRPAELYLMFTKCWIPKDEHLEFLGMTNPSNLSLGLPSWCPNFSDEQVETPLLLDGVWSPQYSAGLKVGENSQIIMSDDSMSIEVKGFRVDKIAEVRLCPWERQNHTSAESKSDGVAEALKWERGCLELSRLAYGTLDEVPEAHWRTLIANKNVNGKFSTGRGREAYHLTKIMMSQLTTTEIPLSPTEQLLAAKPLTDEQLLAVQGYGLAFGYASHGRSFFSTSAGRVGLGPRHAQPGDIICIFCNGYTPYIIRANMNEEHGRTSNRFIGECYVDGLMSGEALEKEDRNANELILLE